MRHVGAYTLSQVAGDLADGGVTVVLRVGADLGPVRRCAEGVAEQHIDCDVEVVLVCDAPGGEAAVCMQDAISNRFKTTILVTPSTASVVADCNTGEWLRVGMSASVGAFVAPLKSCDWWSSPFYLQSCVANLKFRREAAGWLVGSLVHCADTHRFEPRAGALPASKWFLDSRDILKGYPLGSLSGVVFRRSALAAIPDGVFGLPHFEKFVAAYAAWIGVFGATAEIGVVEAAQRKRRRAHDPKQADFVRGDLMAERAAMVLSLARFDRLTGGAMQDAVVEMMAVAAADLASARLQRDLA